MGMSNSDILYRRDNYHKWPWKAILITCTVSGIIFLYIGIPRTSLSGSSLYMSIGLTVVGVIVLLPIIIILPMCLAHKICKACDREVPKCCLCLDPLLARNRAAKKNINFYEHKAKTSQKGGRPSVFVIQVPDKHSRNSNHHPGQSIALSTHSSHSGRTPDYRTVETEFNSNQSQSSRIRQGSSSYSTKSNGSAKSSTTLRQEAAKSQFGPTVVFNPAYLDDESSRRSTAPNVHRSHDRSRQFDNHGFSAEGGGDPAAAPKRHHQHLQQNGQPIEVLVEIVDSMTGDTTVTTKADSTNPATDNTKELTAFDGVDENNNMVETNNRNNTTNSSRSSNRLSVDTDIIIEEDDTFDDDCDKDSAICDVEEYVFGGADEIVDARNDFRTDRHSPHSKIDDPKEEFHFDHTSSVHSSDRSDPDMAYTMDDDDLPSDCTIVTSASHRKQMAQIVASRTATNTKSNKASEQTKANSISNSIENISFLGRSESDRSLDSFFTQTTSVVSRDKIELERINSQLDPGDTYSLVSEAEYSIATDDIISRSRIEDLELRANYSENHSLSQYSSKDDWKSSRWNQSTELGIFVSHCDR